MIVGSVARADREVAAVIRRLAETADQQNPAAAGRKFDPARKVFLECELLPVQIERFDTVPQEKQPVGAGLGRIEFDQRGDPQGRISFGEKLVRGRLPLLVIGADPDQTGPQPFVGFRRKPAAMERLLQGGRCPARNGDRSTTIP